MKNIFTAAALLLMMVMSISSWAQEAEEEEPGKGSGVGWQYVQLKLDYWTAFYTGDIKVETEGIGETINLQDELGLRNPRGVWDVNLEIRLGQSHRIIFGLFTADYEGKETLSTDTELDGYTFALNTNLGTRFEFSQMKLLHAWSPFHSDAGSLSLLWGVEYYYWVLGYEGTEVTTGLKIEREAYLPIPVPVVGLEGELNLPAGFGLYAGIVGMGGKFFELLEAGYMDWEAGVRWQYDYVYVGAGYRSINTFVQAEEPSTDSEFNLNLQHAGWAVTVGAQL
jgi:hypothetical protein